MNVNPTSATFIAEADPDNPGWLRWGLSDSSLFNAQVMAPLIARVEDGAKCRVRMFPERRHANVSCKFVHGGVLLALADISLFAGLRLMRDSDAEGSVTLDMSSQFISGAQIETPLDAVVEILDETGRMAFMRGLIEQEGRKVASYAGTLRKFPKR